MIQACNDRSDHDERGPERDPEGKHDEIDDHVDGMFRVGHSVRSPVRSELSAYSHLGKPTG